MHIELPELIVSAAAKNPVDGIVIPSIRHADEIFFAIADRIYGKLDENGQPIMYHSWVQGFISNRKNFYTRSEAMDIARANGQLRRDSVAKGLFSENLY